MGYYRKKPVVIEAYQVDAPIGDRPQWYRDAIKAGILDHAFYDADGAYVKTSEGRMHASPGDWIIKGVKGELYPCKPDIFEATYEPAPAPGSDA